MVWLAAAAACGGSTAKQSDPVLSSLTTDRDTAIAGVDTVSITITLRDVHNQPIAGATVDLVVSGSANAVTTPPSTDESGATHASWTSTYAETKTVAATVDGEFVGMHDVAFVAGPPIKLAFAQQPADVDAGSVVAPAVAIVAQDAFGNAVATVTGSVHVALGTNPTSTNLLGTADASFIAGTATFADLAIDVASPGYTLVASATGLSDGTSNPFAVLGGDPSPMHSSIAIAPHSAKADGVALVTITTRWANANGIAIADLPVTVTANGTNNIFTPVSGTTDATGTFVATLASTTAEVKTVAATASATSLVGTANFIGPGCTPTLGGSKPWQRISGTGFTLSLVDVDHDGHLDAIVAEPPASKLAVYLGTATGQFGAEIDALITISLWKHQGDARESGGAEELT